MPNSRPPRRAHRGSRSGRDLRSGRLDVDSSTPAGSSTPHRTPPRQGVHLGSASGPGPGAGHTARVSAGPGHFRGTNRKPILIAAGVAAAAGGGGLVYDARRRRKRVSKLYDPFSGQTVDFGKADDDDTPKTSSGGRKALAGAFPGYHGAIAARPGRRLRSGGRETLGAALGSVPGAVLTGAAAARGNMRGAMAGQLLATGGAAAGAVHANNVNQRKGYLKPEFGKAFPVAVPVTSSRSVTPIVPRGRHVSTENDLSVTTRRGRRRGSPSALENYHSGDQSRDTGGGASFGHGARKVSKNDQFAAARGRRGTPLSGIAQAGRVGHRLTIV